MIRNLLESKRNTKKSYEIDRNTRTYVLKLCVDIYVIETERG